jgi:hypothetical protein
MPLPLGGRARTRPHSLRSRENALENTDASPSNGRFKYKPQEGNRPMIINSQRFHIRATTPQVGVTVHGSITFREEGYGLPA